MAGQLILPEALRSIDSATFTGVYQTIGIPLAHPCSLVKLVNNSTVLVTISWDGINDHDILPPNSFVLYDIQSNHAQFNGLYIRQGIQFYVKGAAGVGLVYLTVLYIIEG